MHLFGSSLIYFGFLFGVESMAVVVRRKLFPGRKLKLCSFSFLPCLQLTGKRSLLTFKPRRILCIFSRTSRRRMRSMRMTCSTSFHQNLKMQTSGLPNTGLSCQRIFKEKRAANHFLHTLQAKQPKFITQNMRHEQSNIILFELFRPKCSHVSRKWTIEQYRNIFNFSHASGYACRIIQLVKYFPPFVMTFLWN